MKREKKLKMKDDERGKERWKQKRKREEGI